MTDTSTGDESHNTAGQDTSRDQYPTQWTEGFISSLIPQLARAHRAHAYALLREIGLSPSQELLLMQIWENGPQRPAQLAEVFGVTAPTISKMITRMEKAGLVEKTPSKTDKRASVVSCTEKGNQLQEPVRQVWDSLEQRTVRSLNGQEEAELKRILTKIISDMDSQMNQEPNQMEQAESTPEILIVGVGGLGSAMIDEALKRGLSVSVMVRDESKLRERIAAEKLAKLKKIYVGDASDPETLDPAMQGIDVVISGRGAHLRMARELSAAVKRNGVKKLLWPAGGSNVMAEDGVTPLYLKYLESWPDAGQAYNAHKVCIDAIQSADINYMILCPGRMDAQGARSKLENRVVRVNRETGMYTSYEDAAWVMLESATTDKYDRQLVSVATNV